VANTETRIYTTEHAILGRTGAPSDTLAPGGHTLYDEDNDAHKAIKADIDSGRAPHLRIEKVDLDAEQRNEKARQKLLGELEDLSGPGPTAQDKELARARSELSDDGGGGAEDPDGSGGGGEFNPEENSVADVLEHLKGSDDAEVERVKSLEAASSRSSKQVADFEKKTD